MLRGCLCQQFLLDSGIVCCLQNDFFWLWFKWESFQPNSTKAWNRYSQIFFKFLPFNCFYGRSISWYPGHPFRILDIKIYQGVMGFWWCLSHTAVFLRNERMSSTGFPGSHCRSSLSDTSAVQHKLLYQSEAKQFIRFSLTYMDNGSKYKIANNTKRIYCYHILAILCSHVSSFSLTEKSSCAR